MKWRGASGARISRIGAGSRRRRARRAGRQPVRPRRRHPPADRRRRLARRHRRIVGIIVVLGIIWFATGSNPLDMLTGGGGGSSTTSSQSQPLPPTSAEQDELRRFRRRGGQGDRGPLDRGVPSRTTDLSRRPRWCCSPAAIDSRLRHGRCRHRAVLLPRTTRRFTSTSASTISCASSSARRATSRRPM